MIGEQRTGVRIFFQRYCVDGVLDFVPVWFAPNAARWSRLFVIGLRYQGAVHLEAATGGASWIQKSAVEPKSRNEGRNEEFMDREGDQEETAVFVGVV